MISSRSVQGVDVGVVGRVVGVNGDPMAEMRAVGIGALHAFPALRAVDEHWLAMVEAMKPFEEVDSAQGDPLHRITDGARGDELGEEPGEEAYPVSQIGWLGATGRPAVRNSSAMGSWGPKTNRTKSMGTRLGHSRGSGPSARRRSRQESRETGGLSDSRGTVC